MQVVGRGRCWRTGSQRRMLSISVEANASLWHNIAPLLTWRELGRRLAGYRGDAVQTLLVADVRRDIAAHH